MKALLITKYLKNKKSDLKIVTKALDAKKISFDIVTLSEVDSFYEEIHKKNYKGKYDFLISFGGDGTILKSARIARKLSLPIFGINAGTIGFLTSLNEFKEIGKYLDRIKKKDIIYEKRFMLDVKVIRNKKTVFNSYAVNEATITTSNITKMGTYEVSIGKEQEIFNEYRADGLIISSPTGSTGHSLSAGGPIVAPDVNCFIITAICPHAFNQRSIIVNDKKDVYIKNIRDGQIIDIDGRIDFELYAGDNIKVSRLDKEINFITFEENHFIKNIKRKIRNI